MFQAPKLTNAGKALYYDSMDGGSIKFTTIQMGDGNLTGSIAQMTALVNPIVTMTAGMMAHTDYAEVFGQFDNAGLSAGFYWREIGVFVANPDAPDDREQDILYCYQNAYDTADFLPAASVETVEKKISVPIKISDAAEISCALDKSQIYLTEKDLEDGLANITINADNVQGLGDLVDGKIKTLENSINDELQEYAPRSSYVAATLAAASWTGDAAPYTQTITVDGLTAEQNGTIFIDYGATADEREAARNALLAVSGQAAGELTIAADGDKPDIDIPVRIVLLG
jgi:hypothetical protein